MSSAEQPDHDVAIVGAGFSGIGAAIMLDRAGFPGYVVLEQDDGVGGAWHANTYPGVAVDIPSFSYCFSFEQDRSWSRSYAAGAELKAYAEHCVDKYGLRSRIRLNTKIVDAEFDDDRHLWRLTTAGGEQITARHIIGAAGVLTQPKRPDIAGLDDFAGTVMHTARWDHRHDLTGRRVAIIGTGASALQVIPAIAPIVDQLTVFQRTPIWCLPKLDIPMSPFVHSVLRNLPLARGAVRLVSQTYVEATFVLAAHYHRNLPAIVRAGSAMGRQHLRRQVTDPQVREKLTPRYNLGCKRPSFSNQYLRTFNRRNVTLETSTIEAVTETGIRTVDGVEHQVDTLILATGFKVFETGNMPPIPVRGVRGADLEDFWDANRFQAYQGVSVPAFPNWFTILGPYGFNGSSYFQLIETQMRHILRCLTAARRRGATLIEVTAEANERYFRSVLAKRGRQVFFNSDCSGSNSYYFDRHGDVPFRPDTSLEAHWRSARFSLDDYRFESLAPAS